MFTCYLCFVFVAASQFITGARGQCEGVIKQMNVTKGYTKYLKSPGHGRYDDSDPTSPCQWLLRAQGGGDFLYLAVLAVELDDFTKSPCTHRDRVDIHDGSDENSPLLVTLCGKTKDNDDRFYSSQPLVFINFIFHSTVQIEDSKYGRGFHLQIESVDISQKTTTIPPKTDDKDDDWSIKGTIVGVVITAWIVITVVVDGIRRHYLHPSLRVADSPANTDTDTQSPANPSAPTPSAPTPSAPTLASTALYANSNTTAEHRLRAREELMRSGGNETSSPRFGGGNTDTSRDGYASSDEVSSPRSGGGNTDSTRDGYVSSSEHADTGCLNVGEAPPSYDSVFNEDNNAQEEFGPSGGDDTSSPRFDGGNTDSSRDGFVSSDGLTGTGCLMVREAPPSYDSVVNGDCRLQLSLPVQLTEATVITDITPKPE